MSKYTTEVRFICETYAGLSESVGYNKVLEVVDNSWEKVFDFDFPMFDEEYRSVLCKKILLHYYTREIGVETVGLWKLRLMTKMNEIMPYYNELYKTTLIEYDPLRDADYTKEHGGSGQGNSGESGNANNSGTAMEVFSDTPQGSLQNVVNNTYLTNATKRDYSNSGSNSRSANYSNTDQYVDHVFGKFPGKSYQSLIKEFRQNLINTDMLIIDELSGLFMKLW